MRKWHLGQMACTLLSSSNPLMPGMEMSVMTISNRMVRMTSSASTAE